MMMGNKENLLGEEELTLDGLRTAGKPQSCHLKIPMGGFLSSYVTVNFTTEYYSFHGASLTLSIILNLHFCFVLSKMPGVSLAYPDRGNRPVVKMVFSLPLSRLFLGSEELRKSTCNRSLTLI